MSGRLQSRYPGQVQTLTWSLIPVSSAFMEVNNYSLERAAVLEGISPVTQGQLNCQNLILSLWVSAPAQAGYFLAYYRACNMVENLNP